MRRFDDPVVECPYDKAHKMPLPRLQWHLCRCKAKQERDAAQLPTYHCKFNFLHIFFDEQLFKEHEVECEKAQEEVTKKTEANRLSKTWDALNLSDDSWDGEPIVWDASKRQKNKTQNYWGQELDLAASAPELVSATKETCNIEANPINPFDGLEEIMNPYSARWMMLWIVMVIVMIAAFVLTQGKSLPCPDWLNSNDLRQRLKFSL